MHTLLCVYRDAALSSLEPVLQRLVSALAVSVMEDAQINAQPEEEREQFVWDHPRAEEPVTVTAYATVLARAFVLSPAAIVSLLARWEATGLAGSLSPTGPLASADGGRALHFVVAAWVDHFDEVGDAGSEHPVLRKAVALSLLSLLPLLSRPDAPASARPLLSDRLFDILNCAGNVLAQLDSLPPPAVPAGDARRVLDAAGATAYADRRRGFDACDALIAVDFRAYLRQSLLVRACGENIAPRAV
jgi:hypothetical protein